MSLIFDLPEDISRCLFVEWLQYKEFGLLDCSIGNKYQKNSFNVLLKTIPDVRVETQGKAYVQVYNWMWAKQLNLRNIHLSVIAFDSLDSLRFNLDFDKIHELIFNFKIASYAICSIVGRFQYLRSISSNKATILPHVDKNVLSSLINLTISERVVFPEDGLEFVVIISKYCTSLRSLSLLFGSNSYYTQEYITILRNNPNIEHLCWFGNDAVLQAVMTYCPKLVSARLEGEYSFQLIAAAIQSLSMVNSLTIGSVRVQRCLDNVRVEVDHQFGIQWSDLFSGLVGINQFIVQGSGNIELSPLHIDQLVEMTGITLKSVSIMSFDSYSSDCVASILLHCRGLQSLAIRHDGRTNPVQAFQFSTPVHLTVLRFSGSNFGVLNIIEVIKCCPALIDFTFRGVSEEVVNIPVYKSFLYDLHAVRDGLTGIVCFNTLIMNNFINRRVKLVFKFGYFGGVLVEKYLTPDEIKQNSGGSSLMMDLSVD